MLILAIDTSGPQGSVALARGQARGFELLDLAAIPGGTFSAELVPQIAALLAHHNLGARQVEAFAAASGPGSFTGLRVGLAAIKALAEVLERPITSVSLLQALAATQAGGGDQSVWKLDPGATVAAVLNAGRGEFYLGEYEFARPLPRCRAERVATLEELVELASGASPKVALVTPEAGLIAELEQRSPRRLWARTVPRPNAADVARLGLGKLLRGEVLTVDQLQATYIRRSDAELFSLPKILGEK